MTSTKLSVAHCWIPKMGSTFMHRSWSALNRAPQKTTLVKKGVNWRATSAIQRKTDIPSSKRKDITRAFRLTEFWKSEVSYNVLWYM